MNELVDWLRAQLDEDEKRALRADRERVRDAIYRSLTCYSDDLLFFARHDPARVLREVAAKRAIVSAAGWARGAENNDYTAGWAEGLEHSLYMLAVAYADRPGYREEWKP